MLCFMLLHVTLLSLERCEARVCSCLHVFAQSWQKVQLHSNLQLWTKWFRCVAPTWAFLASAHIFASKAQKVQTVQKGSAQSV